MPNASMKRCQPLANVIVITAMLSTIWTSTSINFVYVLTNGGPAGATMTFPMLAYQIGVAGAQRLDETRPRLGAASSADPRALPDGRYDPPGRISHRRTRP